MCQLSHFSIPCNHPVTLDVQVLLLISGWLNSETYVLRPCQTVEFNILRYNWLSLSRVVYLNQHESVDSVRSRWTSHTDELPLPKDMSAVVQQSQGIDDWDWRSRKSVVDICCSIWLNKRAKLGKC